MRNEMAMVQISGKRLFQSRHERYRVSTVQLIFGLARKIMWQAIEIEQRGEEDGGPAPLAPIKTFSGESSSLASLIER